MFTVSPIAVYSSRRSEPTLPDMNGPLAIPTPISNPSPMPSATEPVVESRQTLVDHLARGAERPIGVVIRLDRRAEHGEDPVTEVREQRAAGVEDRTAHLLEVPVEDVDDPVPAACASANAVNPRRSVKSAVPTILMPPSRRSAPLRLSMSSTMLSGRKRANAPRTRFRSSAFSRARASPALTRARSGAGSNGFGR